MLLDFVLQYASCEMGHPITFYSLEANFWDAITFLMYYQFIELRH